VEFVLSHRERRRPRVDSHTRGFNGSENVRRYVFVIECDNVDLSNKFEDRVNIAIVTD
jgi:hypothetical protein